MVNREGEEIEGVKIIDLGLAKSLGESESKGLSIPGSFAGTPAYSSPEQFSGVGVDIRSDLYSLGVTLWEMLTGELPFKGTGSELVYQHQHAALPIASLSAVPPPVTTLLEVLLEKSPTARFQTPTELISAIGTVNRALGSGRRVSKTDLRSTVDRLALAKTVSAKPRILRWSRDRRAVLPWLVVAGLLALLSLSGVLVFWITGRQNEQSRQLAEIRGAMGEMITQFPQKEADQRQAQAKLNPDSARARVIEELAKQYGLDPTLVEKQLPRFAEQLKRAPGSTGYERASAAYVAKDYNEAERLALAAADEAQGASPPKDADAVKAFELAAWAAENRIDYAEALLRLRNAEKLTDRSRDPVEWARVQFAIAYVLYDQGKYADAERLLREVITERERSLGAEQAETLRARYRLAVVLWIEGKNAEAENEDRAVLKLQEKILGAEHPDTLKTRDNLVAALLDQGKYAEAEAECRAVLKISEKVLGPEDPDTLKMRMDLALAFGYQGKYQEAEAEYRAVIALEEKVLGPEHPNTLLTRGDLAVALDDQGKRAEAETEDRAVLQLQEKVNGAEDPGTLRTRDNLATALEHEGRREEAESEYRAVLNLREKVLGAEHPDTLLTCFNLAQCLRAENQIQEAADLARRAAQGARKILGVEHPLSKKCEKLVEELG
jgi:tetratricopeptide (TPR) repeat protein